MTSSIPPFFAFSFLSHLSLSLSPLFLSLSLSPPLYNLFRFNCYVFQCTIAEKAHTLALAIAKAFYLAYQIIQEQQGKFPSPPERELLFEPQRPDDTTSHPERPTIQISEGPSDGTHPDQVVAEVSDLICYHDDLYLLHHRHVYTSYM